MAIKRQENWLGQQRVDVPHLKSIESAVANDFDLLAGKMLSGKLPLILKGFTISTVGTAGTAVETLQLNVAGGLLMHYGASESGTIFSVPDTQATEVLSATNSNVLGSFTAGVTNYIGLDLIRSSDTSTSDLVQFYDINTNKEVPETVPLARTMQYKIVISTQNFTVSSNIVPIAKVVTTSGNLISSITDARRMMFRLGSGGDSVSATGVYPWGTRLENPVLYTGGLDPFSGEDKSLVSLKGWMDMMMTSLWEAKGGDYWYSPANRDNVKMSFGQPTITVNGITDNFAFPLAIATAGLAVRSGGNLVTVSVTAHGFVNGQVLDVSATVNDPDFYPDVSVHKTVIITSVADVDHFTYAETGANVGNAQTLKYSSLVWSGIGLIFENSIGWKNTIANSASTGVALPDGMALYVDLIRTSNTTINAAVAPLTSLGYSTIPGRRIIIAWRNGDQTFVKDKAFEIGRFQNPVATVGGLGVVKLNAAPATPLAPVVVSIQANGTASVAATAGNTVGFSGAGIGTGAGLAGLGGANGHGIATIGQGTGSGGVFVSSGTGPGAWGQMSSGTWTFTSAGVRGTGSATATAGNTGVLGEGGNGATSGGYGGIFQGGNGTAGTAPGGPGVVGSGGAVHAGGTVDGIGGDFYGGGTFNGIGVRALGTGIGAGVSAVGGSNAPGGIFQDGAGVLNAGVVGLGRGATYTPTTLSDGVVGVGGVNGTGGIFTGVTGVQASILASAVNGTAGTFTGKGTGSGIIATAGLGAGAIGVSGISTGGGAGSYGVKGIATSASATSYGVYGSSDNGSGIYGIGTNTAVPGVTGVSGNNGVGVIATGVGASSIGVQITTAGTKAIVANGVIDLDGAAALTGTDGLKNTLSKDNITKAWAVIQLNGAAVPTLLAGVNVKSIARAGNVFTVLFGTVGVSGAITTPYAINANLVNMFITNVRHISLQNVANTGFDFTLISTDGTATIGGADASLTYQVHISVHGRQ